MNQLHKLVHWTITNDNSPSSEFSLPSRIETIDSKEKSSYQLEDTILNQEHQFNTSSLKISLILKKERLTLLFHSY
jgi:hypothetical protein